MTVRSYPSAGLGGLTEDQWRTMFGANDGIVTDYAGTAFSLTLINAGSIARIAAGRASLDGYIYETDASVDLVLAVPGTGTATYRIAVQYDPTLNIPDGSGDASAAGPCQLNVWNTALPSTSGESYLLFYKIVVTAGQLLTQAVVTDYRVWLGPALYMNKLPTASETGFGRYPKGAHIWESSSNLLGVSSAGVSGSTSLPTFDSILAPAVHAFPAAGNLVAADTPAVYYKAGPRVNLMGTLKRPTGNLSNGNDVILGTLPAGYRPKALLRFCCSGGSPGGLHVTGHVKVIETGQVALYDVNTGDPGLNWIDLSGVSFRIDDWTVSG